jgi:class 3 adenylate cyclase
MAVRLREPMTELVSHWRRRGFDLGCGMGIAYGYATIGPVGFEGRRDYTALGPTVNLASRLCDLATDGEILIDGRAYEAVQHRVAAEERVVEIRGFRLPVTARNVTRWFASEASTGAEPAPSLEP